jgi:hypothetical protein
MLKMAYKNPEVDKICFDTWFSEGSLKKAKVKLEKDGVLNSWGVPFGTAGICRAAKKYMVNNYEETKQKLLKTYEENGYLVEEKYIEQYIMGMAVHFLRTPERVKFWLVKNGLYGKHVKFLESLITISYD